MTTHTLAPTSGVDNKLSQLVQIMAALRTPETGCPWDLEQDFQSIAHYTIEEAYEVVDAIEQKDLSALREELGDLMLQVVFHSQMAKEAGKFSIEDVIDGICDKMIARHPHVFQDQEANLNAVEQSINWEEQKDKERAAKASTQAPLSALAGVAMALPGLMRAQKLQKRAARVGFDWPDAAQAAAKIREELAELLCAYEEGDESAIEEEAGDLLFSCVNVVRKMGVDAEQAMRHANAKFTKRFHVMEETARQDGQDLKRLDIDELEALWSAAKKREL